MKQGKKLTRKQKELLEENNFNPDDYLLERQSHLEFIFIHRVTKQPVRLER
mgnify:CR=1 FL=1